MCWNKDISINTFIFSCLALFFIYFTNTFTRYKTPFFNNPIAYLFLLSVVSVQLIEYFLWKNLKNNNINNYLSKLTRICVMLQQIFIMLMIPSLTIRYTFLFLYSIFVMILITYYHYKNGPSPFYTKIGKNGHLSREWINYKGYEQIWFFIFLLFYIVPVLIVNNTLLTIFVLPLMFLSLFFYYRDNTFGTMWCWLSNLFLLYFIFNILIIQPYYEYNGLC